MKRLLVAAALALCSVGCARDETPTERELARVAPFISPEPAAPTHALRATFGGSVELLGYDLAEARVRAGESVELTLHFHANGPLPKGTRAFSHLVGEEGAMLQNADRAGLVRELFPPDAWLKGQHIRDSILLQVPREARGETLVRVGFFLGDRRVEVTLPGGGRASYVEIPGPEVIPGPARLPPVPALNVRRAEAIILDGVLDEASWKTAEATSEFVQTMTGAASSIAAHAKVLWDEEFLYFAVEVEDTDLRTPFRDRDDPLWEADVVELFLDPGGRGQDYLELQVSPRGVIFDTHYERRRVPGPIGHADFDSKMESAVRLRGTLDDGTPDEGYTVEARVPFSALAVASPAATTPRAGQEWRANFYVIDVGRRRTNAASWSPPLVPDFHVPGRFGRLRFSD